MRANTAQLWLRGIWGPRLGLERPQACKVQALLLSKLPAPVSFSRVQQATETLPVISQPYPKWPLSPTSSCFITGQREGECPPSRAYSFFHCHLPFCSLSHSVITWKFLFAKRIMENEVSTVKEFHSSKGVSQWLQGGVLGKHCI